MLDVLVLLLSVESNTMFRQAFLLIQYSFICEQYFMSLNT